MSAQRLAYYPQLPHSNGLIDKILLPIYKAVRWPIRKHNSNSGRMFNKMQKTACILLCVKWVGAVLLNQFIVQTEDQNRGSPLPDEKGLMVSI